MSRKVLLVTLLSAFIVGCGSDRGSVDPVASSNGSVSISGEAVVGQALSASATDPDGVESGTESYQWYSDGAAISGATSMAYTLTTAEGGEMVTVVVRYTDSAGLRETVESSAVSIQAAFSLGAMYVHARVDGAACEIAAVGTDGVAAVRLRQGLQSTAQFRSMALCPLMVLPY